MPSVTAQALQGPVSVVAGKFGKKQLVRALRKALKLGDTREQQVNLLRGNLSEQQRLAGRQTVRLSEAAERNKLKAARLKGVKNSPNINAEVEAQAQAALTQQERDLAQNQAQSISEQLAQSQQSSQRGFLGNLLRSPVGGPATGAGAALLLQRLFGGGTDASPPEQANPFLQTLLAESQRDEDLARSLIASREASSNLKMDQGQLAKIQTLLSAAKLQQLGSGSGFGV